MRCPVYCPLQVIATGVIKQNGGIKQGAFQERVKFGTGLHTSMPSSASGTARLEDMC